MQAEVWPTFVRRFLDVALTLWRDRSAPAQGRCGGRMRRELKKLMAEATFEPFAFVTDSGDRYEVREWNMAVQEGDVILFRHSG